MLNYINFTESGKKETKKKVHEEVIAEDYDNTKEEINQIDISQKFMVSAIMAEISSIKFFIFIRIFRLQ